MKMHFIKNKKLNTIIRKKIRGAINPLLLRCTSSIAQNASEIEPPIVISSSPRSGSTWLAEMIASVPGCATIFEPLHPEKVKRPKNVTIGWRPYIKNGKTEPGFEKFMKQIFEGKILNSWTTQNIRAKDILQTKRWVIKFVRANLILSWLTQRFDIAKPILLIRHPCAVINSMINRGWPLLTHPPSLPSVYHDFPELKEKTRNLKEPIEYLAALWCIDYFVPLAIGPPYPFHIVFYEELVQNGENIISQLFKDYDLNIDAMNIKDILRRPSQTASKDSRIYTKKNMLGKWQQQLKNRQIEQIINTVKLFELDFYDFDLEPDYDRFK